MATKKTAAKKTTGKAMVNWSEELARRAQMAAAIEENVGGGGSFISLKGGRLTFQGAEIPGNKMNVVVVDHILEYVYYGDRYDPDSPQTPLAFAFGRDENTIRWHENSIEEIDGEPIAGELCKDSSINQWGSADTGRGKACKNQRRLALLTEDQIEDVEAIEGATPAYIKVPVTSVKGWAGYVRQLANTLQRPPFGVITEISVVPDPKTQFKLQFKLVEAIEDAEIIEALIAKQEVVSKEIDFPYAPAGEDDEQQAERPRGRQQPDRVKRGGAKRPVVPARGGRGSARDDDEERPARRGASAGKASGKRSKY